MADETSGDELQSYTNLDGWVELTVLSHERAIDLLVKRIEEGAQGDLEEDERRDLLYAVQEICENAREWGNQGDASRKIRVSYCIFEGEFVLKVQDEGKGFDARTVPDPTQEPLEVMFRRKQEGKRPGGYGIHMVRKLMDRVMYSDRGNVVLLSKNLRRGGGGGKSMFS